MTSPERRVPALDANGRDEAPEVSALGLAAEAEAEAAAAEAEARAAAARARAIRLRREADSAPSDHSPDADPAESGDVGTEVDTPSASASRSRRPSRKAMAVGAGIVLLCVSLAASGYMFRQNRTALQQRQRAAVYAAAAREDVAALMSLDVNKAKEDMQRIADNSTGNFKNSFPEIAERLTKGLEQSKVTTTVTVHDVAVESMTDNSAIVLVAATSEATAPGEQPQPRPWHIALGMRMDGGKPKMANIEFVQ